MRTSQRIDFFSAFPVLRCELYSFFKVPRPPGPPAAAWPCAFPLGRLYDSIGLTDCQRFKRYFFGLTVLSMFCTNSPALFCTFCTPCPRCQTPPARDHSERRRVARFRPSAYIPARPFSPARDHSCRHCPVARFRGRGAFSRLWWYLVLSDRGNSVTSGLCGYTGNRRIVNRLWLDAVYNRRTMIDNQYNQ